MFHAGRCVFSTVKYTVYNSSGNIREKQGIVNIKILWGLSSTLGVIGVRVGGRVILAKGGAKLILGLGKARLIQV